MTVPEQESTERPSENAETQRAVFRITIQASIDDVWQELTRTDRVQPAMFNSRMHVSALAAGGQLRMRSPNGRLTAVVGEILEIERPRRFSHTFRFTNYDDPPCTVIYDLEEVEGGVEFTLRVEDMPNGTRTERQMRQGGSFIVNTLKRVVESGKPSLGARLLFAMFALLAPFSPSKAKSEHWPLDRPA